MAFNSLERLGIAFAVFLVLYLVKFLFSVIYTYALGPALNKVDFKSKGKWALVTGCTDGIGKQYARQLASRGCDIVLVSRSLDKLKATAEEIEKDYKVATKIVQADFSDGDSIYEKISREIADLEIGTLVNNVGISYMYPEYFLDIPDWEKLIANVINTNMVSVTRMTGLVLPGMVKRGKGVVINIGSASSIIPSPLLSVYAASKAYVDKLTEALDQEYSKKGIIFQCILPGFVCSNMSGIRRSSFFAPTAKAFVKSAIGLVGTVSRSTGYLPHAIFVGAINFIHGATGPFGVWLVTRSMENSRMRALKKFKNQKSKVLVNKVGGTTGYLVVKWFISFKLVKGRKTRLLITFIITSLVYVSGNWFYNLPCTKMPGYKSEMVIGIGKEKSKPDRV